MTDQLSAGIASQQRSKAPEGVLLPHVASLPARVGIFGIGLATYWPQFPGLKERLEGYQHRIEEKLAAEGYTIISAGLVDTAPEAKEAGERFMRENVDILLCYVGTYATSSQVVPAVHYVNKPVLVLNLQPTAALNYEHTDTAEWLANCCACCVPEIAGAFTRCNIPFNVVSGLLHEEEGAAGAQAWKEIREWIRAAQVVRTLHYGRIGFLGHTYPGMLDMYSDFTMVTGQTGLHIEVLEMDDLHLRVEQADPKQVQDLLELTSHFFEISEDSPSDPLARAPRSEDLEWSARVAVGLDALRKDFSLDAISYYYRGLQDNANERLGAGVILGNTLLTGRGIPCSGEGDLKNAIAMLIMDRLGAGGSYTEFYAMDFVNDFLLMGHDGPFHVQIAETKPILRGLGLYHGKRGQGVSVEARVKTGPITILTVTQTAAGRLKFIVAEGEAQPGPILRIGNTNSRLKFSLPPAEFMDQWCSHGPTHHCALGVGHHMKEIVKIGRLLGIEVALVA
jgi:L-arabinose isomerase